jgi:rhodanese-related sulfurtransferase/DNA-binding transcriptional ArsR family regulator
MSGAGIKLRLFEQLAIVARAVGHEHRLEILEQLGQGERSVETLTERTGLSVANTSQHLQQLRRAGVVRSRRDGKRVFYRLSDDSVVFLLSALRTLAERNLAEVQQVVSGYFQKRDDMEPVSRTDLLERMREKSVTLLDVRPEDEYALGHLPGALNIPFGKLERRLRDLPKSKEIVAYCRGPYCVLSFEAIAALRKRGYKVRRLEDGYPEWKAAGLAVEA